MTRIQLHRNARTERFRSLLQKFGADRRGATAMLFALSAIPLTMMAGAAVDYARSLGHVTKLRNAADAAALAAASLTSDPADLTNPNLYSARNAAARAVFNASLAGESGITNLSVATADIPNGFRVTATGSTNNFFGGLLGLPATGLSAAAEAGLAVKQRMEIAFVLDNTGSMASNNKMPLLKTAMRKFLNKLQAGIKTPGEIKVSLVPFDTKVRVDPMFAVGKSWMRQPIGDLTGWNGCIPDRNQPYDANATPPALITPDTLFDAIDGAGAMFPNAAPVSCNLLKIMPLTTDFTSYAWQVDSMSPTGMTNGTVGLVWGLHTLTPAEPFNNAAAFGSVRKVLVFLTDGANTQNRWTSNPPDIDARMSAACTEIKSKGVELFTIGLVDANMSVLRPCASSSTMAYQVSDPNKIPDLFDMISQELVAVRLLK